MACSGPTDERDPPPGALYRWYKRNAELTASVLRDAEYNSPTREIAQRWMGERMAAYHEVLGAGLSPKQRAALNLALGFFTWRSLVREAGLPQDAAVNAMIQAMANQS